MRLGGVVGQWLHDNQGALVALGLWGGIGLAALERYVRRRMCRRG